MTLHELAVWMRGMPRDAPILIRLPDGRLVHIDHVSATYARDTDDGLADGPAGSAGRYAIVLAVKGVTPHARPAAARARA